MFPVYLLEDNLNQQEQYSEIVNNTIVINNFSMELVLATDNVEELLNEIKNIKIGMFFLDMEINGDTTAGLKAATRVREQLPLAQIVFITTHEELSFLTLERRVAPLDYILKENTLEKIQTKISTDIINVQHQQQKTAYQEKLLFNYKIGSRFFSIPMEKVILVKTNKLTPGQLTVIASGLKREAEFPGNLNQFEKEYPNLFRCDKSFLINPEYISNYESKTKVLLLNNEISCKVSFRKSRELVKMLKQRGA
ncbi:response regulator transcription factor [Lactiplantibacillus songbeiensis]|uniref:Response regulator transcription factor n=1 Tax=Lactiplantibacillus songbeiensis TaxID=2559920 RepID=A0ABW4BXI4_9LACO|nr:response regulator transcription factor [Lactiplantibacillus songbeiensis]